MAFVANASIFYCVNCTTFYQCLQAVARDVGKTQSQVAINWAMRKGTVPIPGARTLAQAEENLGAVGWSLSPAAVEQLDVASAGVKKKMIENVFQTS